MDRGVYFDGWYRGQHCYHPSLPPRRLRMVEDLERLHGTTLLWSALGGGSISLPYLEDEAYGEVASRQRFYGVVNDSEFIAECDRRGIKVFGVVFEAQGWELPAELDPTETSILALNELRGAGHPSWLGLREFGNDRYPGIWPRLGTYFHEGVRNSRGEVVTDLIDECVSRSLDGSPHRARWVECPDRTHECYYMDRNNPVWREYLKAVVRVQVDAGVHGVQLDEAATPMTTLQYGGCYCHDCTTGFRAYLSALPAAELPSDLVDEDLSSFDYGAFLRARKVDPVRSGASTPLMREYFTFQRKAVTETFVELADYVRDYARSKGRDIQVTGNLFNVFPYYNGIIEHVDLVVTEMRNVSYCQPAWFRYIVGMAADKQVLVVENPYGGVVPELLGRLDHGEAYDLARLLSYEASAMGANMAVPYGAWMGSEIEDAFYLPDELAVEIQSFLKQIDDGLSNRSANDVCVLFDVATNAVASLWGEIFVDNRSNETTESDRSPFWNLTTDLGLRGVPFDVVAVNDDVVRARRFRAEDLQRYTLVLVPSGSDLPDWAYDALQVYAEQGGHVVYEGGGERVGQTSASGIDPVVPVAREASRVAVDARGPIGANTHLTADHRQVLHLVNYDLDLEQGKVRPQRSVRVRVPHDVLSPVRVLRPDGPVLELRPRQVVGGGQELTIPTLGVYALVELRTARRIARGHD